MQAVESSRQQLQAYQREFSQTGWSHEHIEQYLKAEAEQWSALQARRKGTTQALLDAPLSVHKMLLATSPEAVSSRGLVASLWLACFCNSRTRTEATVRWADVQRWIATSDPNWLHAVTSLGAKGGRVSADTLERVREARGELQAPDYTLLAKLLAFVDTLIAQEERLAQACSDVRNPAASIVRRIHAEQARLDEALRVWRDSPSQRTALAVAAWGEARGSTARKSGVVCLLLAAGASPHASSWASQRQSVWESAAEAGLVEPFERFADKVLQGTPPDRWGRLLHALVRGNAVNALACVVRAGMRTSQVQCAVEHCCAKGFARCLALLLLHCSCCAAMDTHRLRTLLRPRVCSLGAARLVQGVAAAFHTEEPSLPLGDVSLLVANASVEMQYTAVAGMLDSAQRVKACLSDAGAGYSVLHAALDCRRHVAATFLLWASVEGGANLPRMLDAKGRSPLYSAVRSGSLQVRSPLLMLAATTRCCSQMTLSTLMAGEEARRRALRPSSSSARLDMQASVARAKASARAGVCWLVDSLQCSRGEPCDLGWVVVAMRQLIYAMRVNTDIRSLRRALLEATACPVCTVLLRVW
jgi:hypothetical protein